MNFVIKDDMFYRYKVLALNIFNELLAVLKLYPKFDIADMRVLITIQKQIIYIIA
jgi:hypothetical protein